MQTDYAARSRFYAVPRHRLAHCVRKTSFGLASRFSSQQQGNQAHFRGVYGAICGRSDSVFG